MTRKQPRKILTGAVDFAECPQYGTRKCCRCGICRICGFEKHTAVHGPHYGCLPMSEPYDHKFTPKGAA